MQMLNPQGLLGDRLLDHKEVAAILDYHPRTLANWRHSGRMADRLPYFKVGNRIRYKESDVKTFLESCQRTHTE